MATQASSILLDIVMRDLEEFFKSMFTTKWYDGLKCVKYIYAFIHTYTRLRSKKDFATIIATLKDYGKDFREHLNKMYV